MSKHERKQYRREMETLAREKAQLALQRDATNNRVNYALTLSGGLTAISAKLYPYSPETSFINFYGADIASASAMYWAGRAIGSSPKNAIIGTIATLSSYEVLQNYMSHVHADPKDILAYIGGAIIGTGLEFILKKQMGLIPAKDKPKQEI